MTSPTKNSMRPSPIICLLLSSILLLSGCAISRYKHLSCDKIIMNEGDLAPVLPPSGMVKYKTSIDVLKNHLTGLLVVKKTDSLTTRIVFVTELGMKMFDFEARNNKIETLYVFDPLNKPVLTDALKRNFNDLLLLNAYSHETGKCTKGNRQVFEIKEAGDKSFYTIEDPGTHAAVLQETFHKHKRISRTEYTYDKAAGLYSRIKAKQYGLVKFYFELNAIPPSND